jgi:hypothetical protein
MTGHTYTRRAGGEEVEVHRAPIAHHAERVRQLNAAGHPDAHIARVLGLADHNQVRGIRRRARPPIPAAVPRGRPRKDPDRADRE